MPPPLVQYFIKAPMHLTAGVAGELLLLGALLPLCAHAYEADSYWDLLGLTPVCSAIKLLQSKGNHHWALTLSKHAS